MPLYRPTELNQFLDSIGAKPNKKLSQNFLIDGNIIRNIIKEADVHPGDYVLEIGPGPGSMTEVILEKGAYVVAVETDRALAAALGRLDPSGNNLKVLVADALEVPLEDLYAAFPDKTKPIKLLSNLPYHITTPLLTRFVDQIDRISMIIVMVQEEMGRRMSSKAGSKEYGSITVFLNFFSKVSYVFKVGRKCFYPAPKVDSCIIRIDPKPTPKDVDVEGFFQMTRRAFQQRRKSMRNSLKELYTQDSIVSGLEKLNLSPLTRPEELSCEQLIEYSHLLVPLPKSNH